MSDTKKTRRDPLDGVALRPARVPGLACQHCGRTDDTIEMAWSGQGPLCWSTEKCRDNLKAERDDLRRRIDVAKKLLGDLPCYCAGSELCLRCRTFATLDGLEVTDRS